MSVELPLLGYYAKKTEKNTLKQYVILLIQHVLSDLEPFLFALKSIGAINEQIFIVSIPYSTKPEIVERIINEYKVKIYESKAYPFDKNVNKAIIDAIEICKSKNLKLVIVEDGGYAVSLMHKNFKNDLPLCIGAVEQTTNGIWRAEELVKELNQSNEKLAFPVISIPDCTLKQKIEGQFVGKAVVKNVQNLLTKIGQFIEGKRVCIIGYGTIGENVAEEAKNQNAIVSIADIDPIKLLTARLKGFETGSVLELMKKSDVVIGTTGRQSIGRKEIMSIKNNTILVSASSKRLEIDVDELEYLCEKKEDIDIGTWYNLVNGNKILLLANGFPVNFFQSESVPNKVIDMILTLLLQGAILVVKNNLDSIIYKCPIEEKDIAKIFHDIHYSHGD